MQEILAIMEATMKKFFAQSRVQHDLAKQDKDLCSMGKYGAFYFHQGKWRRQGAWRESVALDLGQLPSA